MRILITVPLPCCEQEKCSQGGVKLARSNYKSNKRQKELDRKNKQEQKRQNKIDKKSTQSEAGEAQLRLKKKVHNFDQIDGEEDGANRY